MNNVFLLLDAATPQGPLGGTMGTIILMVLIFVVFYFFMIRPQQKKQKKLEEARNALKKGDRIITSGGIYGTIRSIKDREFVIEIAEGVLVRIDKGSVFVVAETEE